MRNLFKTLTILMVFMFSINASFAFSTGKLDKLLKKSTIDETSTVAISIRDVDTNNVVFEQESKKLLHPASTLKVFSAFSALDVLGYDYSFKTQFYKDAENNLYIKLGADPLLTTGQLKQAFQKIKEGGNTTFKNLYFDDSIIDKKEFAPGWMWDDDIKSESPKVSSYNLDGNVVRINMQKSADGLVETTVKTSYPMAVISNITTGATENNLDVSRYNWLNPEIVEIYGSVKSPKSITVPISSMRRYFIHKTGKILEETKISFSGTSYSSKLVPEDAELLVEITNPIKRVITPILHNSDNLMAESIYKIAASVKYNATGTDVLAGEMFKEFYTNNGVKSDNIEIKDGCGISRKNLFSVDWATQALNKLYKKDDFSTFKESMAKSGDGTLLNRLLDLRGEVWLKTGSLTGLSCIVGYVKSQDGHIYSVAIFTQNFIQDQKEIKKFEDEIINIIYNR